MPEFQINPFCQNFDESLPARGFWRTGQLYPRSLLRWGCQVLTLLAASLYREDVDPRAYFSVCGLRSWSAARLLDLHSAG